MTVFLRQRSYLLHHIMKRVSWHNGGKNKKHVYPDSFAPCVTAQNESSCELDCPPAFLGRACASAEEQQSNWFHRCCSHCRHLFHKSCVDPWLLDHRTCPMCKMNILKALGIAVSVRGMGRVLTTSVWLHFNLCLSRYGFHCAVSQSEVKRQKLLSLFF